MLHHERILSFDRRSTLVLGLYAFADCDRVPVLAFPVPAPPLGSDPRYYGLLYVYLAVTLAFFDIILACLALALEILRGRSRLL